MSWCPKVDAPNSGKQVLRIFGERAGHLNVQAKHVEDGFKLGAWLRNRRAYLRQGTYSESQIAALDAISATWRSGMLAPWV